MMNVHRVRTKTLWLFLATFSTSVSVPDAGAVEAASPFSLLDEIREGGGGGASLACEAEGWD